MTWQWQGKRSETNAGSNTIKLERINKDSSNYAHLMGILYRKLCSAFTIDLPSRSKGCPHLSQCSGYECPLLQSTLQTQHHYYEPIHLIMSKQRCALTNTFLVSLPLLTLSIQSVVLKENKVCFHCIINCYYTPYVPRCVGGSELCGRNL